MSTPRLDARSHVDQGTTDDPLIVADRNRRRVVVASLPKTVHDVLRNHGYRRASDSDLYVRGSERR